MKNLKILFLFLLSVTFAFSCEKEEDKEPGNATSPEVIDSDIITTTTLTNRVADSTIADYCITSFISVRNGAGLIIEPGVTIEFSSDAGISVGTFLEAGYIIADGDFTNRITFTGKTKDAGFWRGIAVAPSNNDSKNLLNNCIIEYAGSSELSSSPAGFGYRSAIGVGSASNGDVGFISIKNCTIRNNNGKGYSCKVNSGLNEFFNNEFINNSEEAIYMGAIGFSKIDILTTFSGNGFDGIYQDALQSSIETILDGSINTWVNANGPYFLSRGIRLNNSAAELKLDFGVELIMGTGTMIHSKSGTFTAIGQVASNRISIRGESPGISSWKGIFIESETNNLIKNCDISEGGSAIFLANGCNGKANIGIFYWAGDYGKVTVENCSLNNSGGCGIYNQTASSTQLGDLTQSGNTFSGNIASDICE